MNPTWLAITGAVVGIAGTLSGVLLGWKGHNRAQTEDERDEATADALIKSDVEYIKRGVDDIKLEQRAQRADILELGTRLTRVEESAKQAHKRIDGLNK